MRLSFTPLAEQDLEAIGDYIAADNPKRAVSYLTIAVSLRRFFRASLSEIFRTYMVDCKIRIHSETPISSRQEFLTNVENEVGRVIHNNIEIELGRMESAIPLFSKFVPKSLTSWIMARTQGTNVFYSNPGIINEDFRFFGRTELVIRECSFFGGFIPPYDLMFVTSTVNGQIQVDLIFNQICFDDIQTNFIHPFIGYLSEIVC
jgi:plasmid stabilization system protein ParE